MLLLIVLTWTIAIPVSVLTAAGAVAWWRDRRERNLSAVSAGPARVYQFSPRSPVS